MSSVSPACCGEDLHRRSIFAVSGRISRSQLRAKGLRHAREEQLQVVVDLRHRADGRARALDRVALLDGDGRRDAADLIHLRLVHAVEELPRVGREGLDVAALALGVDRVEGERRLAAAARPGDDVQLAQRQVEVEALEIVLPRAADFDDGGPRTMVSAVFWSSGKGAQHAATRAAWQPARKNNAALHFQSSASVLEPPDAGK